MTIFLSAFLASGALVVVAGVALARHADALAGSSRAGRWWVGSVLLAGATSLPELVTDVAAVRMGATDLAAGDLFGSSVANMLILALLMALLQPAKSALLSGHALTAGLAILLNALAAGLVLWPPESALPLDAGALALLTLYVLGSGLIYRNASVGRSEVLAAPNPAAASARPMLGFGLAAGIIVLAAPLFAWSARELAMASGLGNTFFGTWMVGLATSLPELVASLAALRLGAPDLAVGNLFGSNAFNMAVFALLDGLEAGPIFATLDPLHALTGLAAVALMGVGLGALAVRARVADASLWPFSAAMLAIYLVTCWAAYDRARAAGGSPAGATSPAVHRAAPAPPYA